MKLIDDIIISATEANEPIGQTLRRCLVLAYKLKNESLKAWVENELNGFEVTAELPDYRQSRGTAKGLLLGSFGQQLNNQPLASVVMKEEHRHFATTIKLYQPISAYDGADREKSAVIFWPQDLVVMYQSKFYRDMALNRAWIEVPGSMMAALIDTVRTRILTFALKIRDEIEPDQSEEISIAEIAPTVIDRIINVTIYGGNNALGNIHEIRSMTVNAGDVNSLREALSQLDVTASEFQQLQNDIATDKSESMVSSKSLGAKTLRWVGDVSKRVGSAGLSIGAAAAEEVAKKAIMGYLGLS